jgi:hypoxia up-regulated 1
MVSKLIVLFDKTTISSNLVDKKNSKDIISVRVLDEEAVPGLGGHIFDVELVKILAERFDNLPERQGKESVLNDDKVKRRLNREVAKIKEILSANKEAPVKIVELADEITLEFILERQEFEDRIIQHVEKAKPAFERLFQKHSIDRIDEINILGGGLRVQKVKDYISDLVKGKKLNTHLNPDEAMAFGSAYIAANFSSNYQVQKVYLYQSLHDSIYLNITQMGGCSEEESEQEE